MSTPKAKNLEEAYKVLVPEPLDPAKDQAWYVPRETDTRQGQLAKLHKKLLLAAQFNENARFFVSGHVGSGKSTEIARLSADPELNKRYTILRFRFEEQEWPHLDAKQILFRVAAELYEAANKRGMLKERRHWEPHLKSLERVLYGDKGVQTTTGVQVEWNLLFAKVRQELKLSDSRRRGFREFGDSEQTLLRDLVDALAVDFQDGLLNAGDPDRLLVVVDDLDKVRDPDRQKDIFFTDLNALFAPKVTMLLTLPASVQFGGSEATLRDRTTHLRPVQVLKRAGGARAEDARNPEAVQYLVDVALKRLEAGVCEPAALELAALYSGGVTREFFHLLREAALQGMIDDAPQIDVPMVERALREARVRLLYGLYAEDHKRLVTVHDTHQLASRSEAQYLDRSLVLEYNHDDLWFELHPQLWPMLEEWRA